MASLLISALRWRVEGEPPGLPRYVLIAAPHTSNWDGVLMILYKIKYALPIRWLGKDSLFRGPLGRLMRALDGVPIDRSRSHNMVEQLVALLEPGRRAIVLVTPEATRRRADHWKSGFYYIALGANVPIALGYIDASTRTIGIGPIVQPSGDIARDMDIIAEFYQNKVGIHPANAGPVRVSSA